MLWWLYEFVFWSALLLAGPYYLLRMKRRGGYASGFLERFGIFSPAQRERLKNARPVWIHAVSVGEVDLALQLLQRLSLAIPSLPLALSTTTSTGRALAARKLPPHIPLFYYPLDSIFCFGKVHRLLHPRAFILVEAELWPNHLRVCGKQGIPVILVNARISERFYPRYRKFRGLFASAFESFRRVTVQSENDLRRLVPLGLKRDRLTVVGSLKYDTARGEDPERRTRLQNDLAPFKDRLLWVAGSTHPGEEEILLDILTRLRDEHPKLLLALAPRHAERSAEITKLLRRRGVSHALRSDLGASPSPPQIEVLVLDTTGELKYLYEHAALIFVGKSLIGHGGQNIIEPAIYEKPVLFGPHMENFSSIAQEFLEAKAAIQVQNAEELESHLQDLLRNAAARLALGKRAAEFVRSKQGSMERTMTAICDILRETNMEPRSAV